MYPELKIERKNHEPLTVQTVSADFMHYDDLNGDKRANEHAMRLCMAYYYCEGKDALSLKEVKAWARENDVRVDIVREDVNPTQTDPIAD
jgi:hypothetical protein